MFVNIDGIRNRNYINTNHIERITVENKSETKMMGDCSGEYTTEWIEVVLHLTSGDKIIEKFDVNDYYPNGIETRIEVYLSQFGIKY